MSGCIFNDEELNAAVKTGDPDACLALTNEDGSPDKNRIDKCYSKIAVNKEDSSICERIESSHYSDTCYGDIAIAMEDETLCYKAGSREDDCYKDIAVSKEYPEICKEITSEYTKNNCFEEIAIATTDSKLCKEIQDEDRMYWCLNEYAITIGDAWVCKELKTTKDQEYCYSDVAQIHGDIRVCDEIQSFEGNIYQTCVQGVALKTGDHSVCEKLEDPDRMSAQSEIDDCYYKVGYNHYKASACSAIKDEVQRNTCLVRVAEHNADTDICDERIDRTDYKDECYLKIAWSQDHERYCEEINDPKVKAECLKRFEYE